MNRRLIVAVPVGSVFSSKARFSFFPLYSALLIDLALLFLCVFLLYS